MSEPKRATVTVEGRSYEATIVVESPTALGLSLADGDAVKVAGGTCLGALMLVAAPTGGWREVVTHTPVIVVRHEPSPAAGAAGAPARHTDRAWAEYLGARARVIACMRAENRTWAEIASVLTVDELQVRLIALESDGSMHALVALQTRLAARPTETVTVQEVEAIIDDLERVGEISAVGAARVRAVAETYAVDDITLRRQRMLDDDES